MNLLPIPLDNRFGLLLLVYERFFGPPGEQLLTWFAYGGLCFPIMSGTWRIVTDLTWFRSLSRTGRTAVHR